MKIGEVIDSRYRLDENLWVDEPHFYWRCFDVKLKRDVVLHIVSSNIEALDDVESNMKMSSRLQHPNIIPIFDVIRNADYVYSVQYFAENLSVEGYVESKALNLNTLLRIAQQFAGAVDFIHSQNIIHRHIRPVVMVLDKQLNPYLTEFYLPRPNSDIIDHIDLLAYIAPEQLITSQIVDKRCDIFAFGVTLFKIFTGMLPFELINHDTKSISLGWRLAQGEDVTLPSIGNYRSDIPIGFDVVLRRLTYPNPHLRYSTASEAVDDLYKAYYSGQTNIEGKIFISYARKDSEYVYKLAEELRKIGLDIWIDTDIEVSTNWDDAIETGLNDCDMMLLITTDASMSSEYVTHEWSYFMGQGKPVYPFIPQEPIPENIHPRLSRVQHIVGRDDMLNNVAHIIEVLGKRQKNSKE